MAYPLSEVGNLVVVISGALGSLLLIVFKSKCTSICWGCLKRKVPPISDTASELSTPRIPDLGAEEPRP